MIDKRFHLFWFHHAGGSAAFYFHWQKLLPKEWVIHLIELPGRGMSFNQAFHSSWYTLLESIQNQIAYISPKYFAFAGHSLGAMVAHRLAAYRYKQGDTLPLWLGISAVRTPNLSSKTQYHKLDDNALLQIMKNAFPEKALKHQEVLSMLLTILRSDLYLAETATKMPEVALPIPTSVFYALNDQVVTLDEIQGWQKFSTHRIKWNNFNGDHMYIETHDRTICRTIAHDINQALLKTSHFEQTLTESYNEK